MGQQRYPTTVVALRLSVGNKDFSLTWARPLSSLVASLPSHDTDRHWVSRASYIFATRRKVVRGCVCAPQSCTHQPRMSRRGTPRAKVEKSARGVTIASHRLPGNSQRPPRIPSTGSLIRSRLWTDRASRIPAPIYLHSPHGAASVQVSGVTSKRPRRAVLVSHPKTPERCSLWPSEQEEQRCAQHLPFRANGVRVMSSNQTLNLHSHPADVAAWKSGIMGNYDMGLCKAVTPRVSAQIRGYHRCTLDGVNLGTVEAGGLDCD